MEIQIKILRQDRPEGEPFWQTFLYETEDREATVASALEELNSRERLTDIDGNPARPVCWECSCLQKKCGACAMLINDFPALACEEKILGHGSTVELKPLQKFPVVRDLAVDRDVMHRNLRQLGVWLSQKADIGRENQEEVFIASQCLQCGCCLEICTSYADGQDFYGMSALVPAARVLLAQGGPGDRRMQEGCERHIYEGCQGFNACEHVCPAGLPVTRLMAHVMQLPKGKLLTDRYEHSIMKTIYE